MKRTTRAILAGLSTAVMFGVANEAAIAGTGCSGLCSVTGNITSTAQRSTPCANFGGNVCYIITWSAQVSASSLVAGSYFATTTPDAGVGHSRSCSFLSPGTTSCATSGAANSFIDIVPPNSTKCHSFTSSLVQNGLSTVATDSGTRCRSVGS